MNLRGTSGSAIYLHRRGDRGLHSTHFDDLQGRNVKRHRRNIGWSWRLRLAPLCALDVVDQFRVVEAISLTSGAVFMKLEQVTLGLMKEVYLIRKQALAQSKVIQRWRG